MRRIVLATVGILTAASAAWASNDPLFSQQWALAKVGAELAWATGKGGGVTVAIVDSGVDLDHEDLAAKLVPGFDFVEGDFTPMDENEHGTHVAGIAAAVTGNSRGVAGTAPDAKIMPVRVLDENGEGSSDDVEAGIRWAADHGAKVVNLSLGELTPIRLVLGSSIENAINYAWGKGVVPVVAAGNDIVFPSGYAGVNAIAVAATNQDDGRPLYSNGTGDAKWGMAAPGDRITSTLPNNKYGNLSGTSMASPHVSGAAAILLSLGLTPQQTVDRLLATAKDIGQPGHDGSFGSGRLDLTKAVSGLGKSSGSTDGSGGSTGGGSTKAKPGAVRTSASPPGGSPSPTSSHEESSPAGSPDNLSQQAGEEKGERNTTLLNAIVGGLLVAGFGSLLLWSWLRRRGLS